MEGAGEGAGPLCFLGGEWRKSKVESRSRREILRSADSAQNDVCCFGLSKTQGEEVVSGEKEKKYSSLRLLPSSSCLAQASAGRVGMTKAGTARLRRRALQGKYVSRSFLRQCELEDRRHQEKQIQVRMADIF
jgi:hypothetical protein